MAGKLSRYLVEDHRRLDSLLERAISDRASADAPAYTQFRSGLLKHIAMEEKILLPAAQRLNGGKPLGMASELRLDHGALAALLVPTPTAPILATIGAILKIHNSKEEGVNGVYKQCENLAEAEADQILHELQNAPEVRVAANFDGPEVTKAINRSLAKVGYTANV